jgi:hypothetical protein
MGDALRTGENLYGLSFRFYNTSIMKRPYNRLFIVINQHVSSSIHGTYFAHSSIMFIFLHGITHKVERTLINATIPVLRSST